MSADSIILDEATIKASTTDTGAFVKGLAAFEAQLQTRVVSADPVTGIVTFNTPVPWFEIRPASDTELPAIRESWLGTYKRSQSAGTVPNHLYASVTNACIDGLLARGARVSVLCARTAPDLVLAWVCWERDKRSTGPVIHYIFTKDAVRDRGYASLLLRSIGAHDGRFIYTHATSFAKRWPKAKHNPGIARRKAL